MNTLTDLEKKIIALLQTDIPVAQRPFKQMAQKIGITEETFLAVLRDLNDRGMIRRFGATLKHQKSGFRANAMVAWNVAEDQVEKVGTIMAGFQEITHCYRRPPLPEFPFGLYAMIHGQNEEEVRGLAARLAGEIGARDHAVVFSVREFTKVSMRYFV